MAEGVDPKVFKQALEEWSEGELRCRARGFHEWDDYTCFVNARTIDVHERCRSCQARRHRLMNARTGVWIDPKWKTYDYSDNYQLPKGSGRMSVKQKGRLRLIEVHRRANVVEGEVSD